MEKVLGNDIVYREIKIVLIFIMIRNTENICMENLTKHR